MIPLPDWPRLLIVVAVFGGLTVWILAGHYIADWWRNSITVRCLHWRLADLCGALAYPFRLLRKRRAKSTAGAGASPTLLPPVGSRKDTS